MISSRCLNWLTNPHRKTSHEKARDPSVKTNKGEPLADAESEPVAEEIAERLNEHAYREEHDRWSP